MLSFIWSVDGWVLGKRLAVGYGDGRVRVWDLKGGDALVNVIAHQGNITCIECCNDGSLVASGSDDGSVRFVNPLNGKVNCFLLCLL